MALDVTQAAQPPRAVFLPFMMGHHFGVPFHVQLQKKILLELLGHLENAKESAEIKYFDYTWAQARKEGKALTDS